MKDTRAVPEMYRWNVRKLAAMLCTDVETAYAMILLTASFMDLRPDDPKVTEMILNDCCMEV